MKLCHDCWGMIEKSNEAVWAAAKGRAVHITAEECGTPEALGNAMNRKMGEHVEQAGTVLLVAGSSWASRILRVATKSRFSHVALVNPCKVPGPMCFQSTQPSHSKAQFGEMNVPAGTLTNDGTSMHDMGRYIWEYLELHPGTRFVLRKTKAPLDDTQTTQLLVFFENAVKVAKPYPEINKLALVWAANQSPTIKDVLTTLFGKEIIEYTGEVCSELVADALITAHILKPTKPCNVWYPHDFSLDVGRDDGEPLCEKSTPPVPLFEESEVELIVEHKKP